MTELQTGRSKSWVANDNSIGVGSSFEGSKTTGDDKCAGAESSERCKAVLIALEVCCGPEEDSAEGVETETHENGDLVSLSLHDFSSNWREEQVTTTEVDDLETGGLKLGDIEDSLEMLVQDIE